MHIIQVGSQILSSYESDISKSTIISFITLNKWNQNPQKQII